MATLSFSCPKCNKLHERIKPEMVGHKVRCQCGFVFRLGSKSDKQAWVVDELKRKKEVKASQLRNNSEPVGPIPNPNLPAVVPTRAQTQRPKENDFGLSPKIVVESKSEVILEAIPIVDSPLFDEADEILEAIPLSLPAQLRPTPSNQGIDPLAGPLAEMELNKPYQQLPSYAPRRPKPTRRNKRGATRNLNSPAMPIWMLVLNIIGFPIMAFLLVGFVGITVSEFRMMNAINGIAANVPGSASARLTGAFVVGLLMTMLIGLLLISMITNGVVAIIELAQGIEIKWAAKVSATIASIVVVFMIFSCGYQIFSLFSAINQLEEMGQQFGRTFDREKASQAALGILFWHFLFGIIPFAIAVTGMIRSAKR